MSELANIKTLKRFIEELWNQQRLEVIDDIMRPGYVVHFQDVEPGIEGYRRIWEKTTSEMPDIRFSVRNVVANRDKIGLLYTVETLDTPYAGTAVYRFEENKLAECWAPPRQPVTLEDIERLGPARTWTELPDSSSSHEERNVATIRRFIEEVWNGRKVEVLDEIMHEDYLVHFVKVDPGVEGYKRIWRFVRETRPGIQFHINDFIPRGDTVVMRYDVSGIPNPYHGVVFYRLRDGKMAECWAVEPGREAS